MVEGPAAEESDEHKSVMVSPAKTHFHHRKMQSERAQDGPFSVATSESNRRPGQRREGAQHRRLAEEDVAEKKLTWS